MTTQFFFFWLHCLFKSLAPFQTISVFTLFLIFLPVCLFYIITCKLPHVLLVKVLLWVLYITILLNLSFFVTLLGLYALRKHNILHYLSINNLPFKSKVKRAFITRSVTTVDVIDSVNIQVFWQIFAPVMFKNKRKDLQWGVQTGFMCVHVY